MSDHALPAHLLRRIARRLVVRPHLWGTAIAQLFAFATPRWWSRMPFLPIPDAQYVRFRLETQYGLESEPEPQHVVEYLEWCRSMRALVAARHDGSRS
ncbi:MAG: hypothetical protein ACOYN3_03660 [Acidimicrobiia bacterium]